MDKKSARLKRATKTRAIIRMQGVNRLTVHRTPRHIYAQITTADGSFVIASCSTLERDIVSEGINSGNVEAAKEVGRVLAQRAVSKGITRVAFDRSGFKFHGRVKALADSARGAGLAF